MVRILGNNLSNKKKMYIALTAIYGIGINTSKKILEKLNIDPNSKAPDLSDKNVAELRELLETDEFQLEGDLKRIVSLNIKRLIEISSVRGRKHLKVYLFADNEHEQIIELHVDKVYSYVKNK